MLHRRPDTGGFVAFFTRFDGHDPLRMRHAGRGGAETATKLQS